MISWIEKLVLEWEKKDIGWSFLSLCIRIYIKIPFRSVMSLYTARVVSISAFGTDPLSFSDPKTDFTVALISFSIFGVKN